MWFKTELVPIAVAQFFPLNYQNTNVSLVAKKLPTTIGERKRS